MYLYQADIYIYLNLKIRNYPADIIRVDFIYPSMTEVDYGTQPNLIIKFVFFDPKSTERSPFRGLNSLIIGGICPRN